VFSQQTAAPAGLRGTPAPIDPARLAGALAPHGSSRMLPREAYVDPVVLAWEHANFFTGWVCVGRADTSTRPASRRRFPSAAPVCC